MINSRVNLFRGKLLLTLGILVIGCTTSLAKTEFSTSTNNVFNLSNDNVELTEYGLQVDFEVDGDLEEIYGNTEVNGVSIDIGPESWLDSQDTIKVNYKIKNNTNKDKKISICTYGDVNFFNSKTNNSNSFTLNDDNIDNFILVCRDSLGVTDVDSYNLTCYGDGTDYEKRFEQAPDNCGMSSPYTGIHMSYCWKNRNIAPNETKVFSVLMCLTDYTYIYRPTVTVENKSEFNKPYYNGQQFNLKGKLGNENEKGSISSYAFVDNIVYDEYNSMIDDGYSSGEENEYEGYSFFDKNLTEGNHKLYVISADTSGIPSIPVEIPVKILKDNIPPKCEHTITPNSYTNGKVTINFKITDNESGVSYDCLRHESNPTHIDGNEVVTGMNYNFTFIIKDNAGNYITYPVNITNIDKESPVIRTLLLR